MGANAVRTPSGRRPAAARPTTPCHRGVIQNPYEVYARLRRRSPVHRSAILGSWVLTRYEDVLAAAKDHERFSNNPRWRGATTSVLPPAPDDHSILLVDPPEHARLRRVAAKVFAKAAFEGTERDHRARLGNAHRARRATGNDRLDCRGDGAAGHACDAGHDADPRARSQPLGGVVAKTGAVARIGYPDPVALPQTSALLCFIFVVSVSYGTSACGNTIVSLGDHISFLSILSPHKNSTARLLESEGHYYSLDNHAMIFSTETIASKNPPCQMAT